MKFNWKPQKGKAFDKLPKKTLEIFNNTNYLVSTKYDGNQIFISKYKDTVRFFTSDWKEFNLPKIGEYLIANTTGNFILVTECFYGSEGKLGARTIIQGKLTTERINFKKGLPCSLNEDKVRIKVFDFLLFDRHGIIDNYIFSTRIEQMKIKLEFLPKQISIVDFQLLTGNQAVEYTKILVKDGWEGTMLSNPDEYYHLGKRVNHVIKLKYRPTVDLLCVGYKAGEGKYSNMIGSLLLEDSIGRQVYVGSGLDDTDRLQNPNNFIGKVIEIEYEQIMDTYQQPTIVYIRNDKTKEEID